MKKKDGRKNNRPPVQMGNKHAVGNKGGKGHASEFKPEYVRMASVLGEVGMTDEQLGKVFDVSATAVKNWRKKYPDFQSALTESKAKADNAVVQALFKRAIGYSHPDVDIRTVSLGNNEGSTIVKTDIIKHYPPDATSCLFWLKNRRPAEWRDRQELTGSNGKPLVEPSALDMSKLNVEELLALKAMMDKAKNEKMES